MGKYQVLPRSRQYQTCAISLQNGQLKNPTQGGIQLYNDKDFRSPKKDGIHSSVLGSNVFFFFFFQTLTGRLFKNLLKTSAIFSQKYNFSSTCTQFTPFWRLCFAENCTDIFIVFNHQTEISCHILYSFCTADETHFPSFHHFSFLA